MKLIAMALEEAGIEFINEKDCSCLNYNWC